MNSRKPRWTVAWVREDSEGSSISWMIEVSGGGSGVGIAPLLRPIVADEAAGTEALEILMRELSSGRVQMHSVPGAILDADPGEQVGRDSLSSRFRIGS